MTTVAMVAAWAMAAVLLWAALEKSRHPSATAMTVRSLGLPERAGMPIAIALAAAELIAAAALLFRPDSVATQAGVLSLAAMFATAGLLALRLDHPVRCNCFGAGNGKLGKRQLIALIPWTIGAAALQFAPRPSLRSAAASLAAMAVTIAIVRAVRLAAAYREARGDRRSAEETYTWLPSY